MGILTCTFPSRWNFTQSNVGLPDKWWGTRGRSPSPFLLFSPPFSHSAWNDFPSGPFQKSSGFSGFSTGVCDDVPMNPDRLPPLLIGAGFESLSVASLIPFGSARFGTCPMST
jgi:hypothetical protein